jgi:hypothetical protein
MRRTVIIIKSINYGFFVDVDVDVAVAMVALRKFIISYYIIDNNIKECVDKHLWFSFCLWTGTSAIQ